MLCSVFPCGKRRMELSLPWTRISLSRNTGSWKPGRCKGCRTHNCARSFLNTFIWNRFKSSIFVNFYLLCSTSRSWTVCNVLCAHWLHILNFPFWVLANPIEQFALTKLSRNFVVPFAARYAKAVVGRLLHPVASATAVSRGSNGYRDTFHEVAGQRCASWCTWTRYGCQCWDWTAPCCATCVPTEYKKLFDYVVTYVHTQNWNFGIKLPMEGCSR